VVLDTVVECKVRHHIYHHVKKWQKQIACALGCLFVYHLFRDFQFFELRVLWSSLESSLILVNPQLVINMKLSWVKG